MAKSLYLINPRTSIPSYFGAEAFERAGLPPAQSIADLATTTVAGMAPDDWQIEICDEWVSEIDFDHQADYIGITGKITQIKRMVEAADEFRRRGKTVVIGGPCASLSPELVRDHADVVVIGELEGIAEELFGDLDKGTYKKEYVADKPDIGGPQPMPRWDLYPNDDTIMGCVQTSRGCPFECEFCDVIQYLGRKQRHKCVEQIIAECDALYELGYRAVFLADDNFTVYRKRAKDVLSALAEWNADRPAGPVSFATQVSIDAARDPEIMELCAQAGLTWCFIGIETPNVDSLKETKKRQNVGVDLLEQIQVFLDHGISVTGGMIVGFDNDGPDIFQVQYDFAMASPIPFFSLSSLVAPAATPLLDRMQEAGRINEGSDEMIAPWDTNIIPVRMTKEQMYDGLKWLCNNLYKPENFGQRVIQMIDRMGPQRGPFKDVGSQASAWDRRPVEARGLQVLKKLMSRGKEERKMWSRIWKAMNEKPDTAPMVMQALFRYSQVRSLYEEGQFWEPEITGDRWRPVGALPSDPASDGLVTIGSGV